MEDEFSTLDHADMLRDEMSREDVLVMAVFAQIRRGISLEQACKNNGISEEYYLANVDRVIYTP